MAENKINEEIMDDAELDAVAGGTSKEIQDDANKLRALGRLPNGPVSKDQIDAAFNNLGLGIGTDLKESKSNSYYINHKKVSREKVWNYIYEHYGRQY